MIDKNFVEYDDKVLFLLRHFEETLHDIKTPVNIILLMQQSLENAADLPEGLRDYVRKTKKYCTKIIDLISQLNDADKILGGRFKARFMNYDIVNLVEDTVQAAASLAERKNISVVFDTDVEEKIIAVDKDLIERILLNLISNAVKYTPVYGTIEVNLYNGRESIEVEVKDNGPGFAEDETELIFNRFQTETSPENREGAGIGLAVVKEMVNILKGTIIASNGINGGARIRVSIPSHLVVLDGEAYQTALF